MGAKIGYWILVWLCRIVGVLPSWFLYHCLLDVICFFTYRVFRYRVKVVRDNLAKAFPEKDADGLRAIEKKFYYHLAEVMVDMIDFVGITPRQVRKRLVIEDLAGHEASVGGANWVAALGHYGSWEYFAAYPLYTGSKTASAYHPLHNKAVDRLMLHSRSRFGMNLVPMRDLIRFVAENRDTTDGNFALGMIIDQSPTGGAAYIWTDFMGRTSRVFIGMEKMAVKFGLKVYFFHMEKPARARYRGRFEMIYDGREQVAQGEVTRRYIERLERQIRERPELWMWSHRRWKHAPPPEVEAEMAGRRGVVVAKRK